MCRNSLIVLLPFLLPACGPVSSGVDCRGAAIAAIGLDSICGGRCEAVHVSQLVAATTGLTFGQALQPKRVDSRLGESDLRDLRAAANLVAVDELQPGVRPLHGAVVFLQRVHGDSIPPGGS